MGRLRLGVLGGTFDPIHLGHLILAEQARVELGLAEVVFVPAGDPWRKAGRRIAAANHRVAMVELAIADNDAFRCSRVEVERAGPSYSADTLGLLARERPDADLFFIVGEDALLDLPNWKDPERIVAQAFIAVARRSPWQAPDGEALDGLVRGLAAKVRHVDMPAIGVSATDIRRRVARGASIRYLVPESVRRYIQERGLYREEP